jgi:hypothetical protein
MSRQHVYLVTVEGTMSDMLQTEFGDVELWISDGQTYLRADLPDSAGLYGLIGRIEELGLVLVDLHLSTVPASNER